ncbi:MAG TPA: DEAD/DEAH box helicase [Polyangia bacterium]|jgi:ATP-dependent RNA helicase DeaD|nr:DEAD/DEAH box helicase [Polyangia bacterium]
MNEETSLPTNPADLAPPEGLPAPEAPKGPSFAELGLHPDVLRAVTEMGFTHPMNVQSTVFPLMVAGRDLMVQSRTGSGKTAAFGIPMANGLVNPDEKFVQAIVLMPTRELALQVAAEMARICAYRGLTVVPVYGGAPMGRQVEQLRDGGQIVCGTPGRVLDHMRRGTLKLNRVRVAVLDECDEMLSMGFQEDIEKILESTPKERQTMLFSATVPEAIQRVSRRFLKNPEFLKLSGDYIGVNEIKHLYYSIPAVQRETELLRILTFEDPKSAIIFCNTREETGRVAAFLRANGHDAEAISSDLAQNDRERVLGRMRAGGIKFLVATDVAARGIDIEALSHVFNYTFPESPEIYVHRTGRTGRAGKNGTAVSLIGPTEVGSFYYLKLLYKIKPEERALPSETEIRSRREGERVTILRAALSADPGAEWRGLARRLTSAVDGERLIAALLAKSFKDVENMPVVPKPPAPVVVPARTESADRDRERPRYGDRERPRDRDRDRPRDRDRGGRDRPEASRGAPRESVGAAPEGGERPPQERGEIRRDWRERTDRPAGAAPADAPAAVTATANVTPIDAAAPSAAPLSERPPRSFSGPRDASRDDRGLRGRRHERKGPAPLRNDTAPTEKEFWEVWSEERGQAGAPTQPSATSSSASASSDVPRAVSSVDGGETPGPVISPPRFQASDELAPGTARLYLNLGRKDGASERDVLALLSAHATLSGPPALDIMNTHTYINVPSDDAGRVCEALTGKELAGRALVCEPAKPRKR